LSVLKEAEKLQKKPRIEQDKYHRNEFVQEKEPFDAFIIKNQDS
jgi:hypothetical protein